MVEPTKLAKLADRVGILPVYHEISGDAHATSDATRMAILAAMGYEAQDEAAASRSLELLDGEARARPLPPVRVARPRAARILRVALPQAAGRRVGYSLELTHEDGAIERREGWLARRGGHGHLHLEIPPTLGYHDVHLELDVAGTPPARQRLIVSPGSCPRTKAILGSRRAFGLLANLYTLRGARNLGLGDLGDLTELLHSVAGSGTSFVGLNPLHAIKARGWDVSPYRPVSRVFRNGLYLDIDAVPELAGCAPATDFLARNADAIAALRSSPKVDYDRVVPLKGAVVAELHREFRRRRESEPARAAAFADYCQRQGSALVDYATFVALDDHFRELPDPVHDWHRWPAEYRDPRHVAVDAFRRQHAEAVEREAWIQFELDRQLARAAATARRSGLRLGLYQDLAIGSAPDGSDPWGFADLFVGDMSIGAPPDPFAAEGQDWGLPPLHPLRMRETAHDYWVRVVRSALDHTRLLRIDHVMGLLRQFWVPRGGTGRDGAYVRFPVDDLMGILALEATRHGALVVGEDLGTVPEGFSAILARWGILSTRVLYFEQNDSGFKPARSYPRRALVTVNTHDLCPLQGWLGGNDLELRHRLTGGSASDLERARSQRGKDVARLLERLRDDRLLPPPPEGLARTEVSVAAHGFVARTPSLLAAASLDDLAGESEPVNLPGIGQDRHPSWSRRMASTTDAILRSDRARQIIAALGRHRRIERWSRDTADPGGGAVPSGELPGDLGDVTR